jgi:hypothetical protein
MAGVKDQERLSRPWVYIPVTMNISHYCDHGDSSGSGLADHLVDFNHVTVSLFLSFYHLPFPALWILAHLLLFHWLLDVGGVLPSFWAAHSKLAPLDITPSHIASPSVL